jgi:hypothetical protein
LAHVSEVQWPGLGGSLAESPGCHVYSNLKTVSQSPIDSTPIASKR